MVAFFRKLKTALAVAGATPRIWKFIDRGQYEDALAVIEALPEREHERLSWRVSKIQLRHFAKRDEEVVRQAPPLLHAIEVSRAHSEDIRKYLRAYVLEVARGSCARLPDCKSRFETPDYEGIELKRVPGSWKREFPLSTHPEWPKQAGKSEAPRSAR